MRRVYWTRRTHLFRRDEYICSGCNYASDKPLRVCPGCKAVMAMGGKYDPQWVDEAEEMSAMMDDDW